MNMTAQEAATRSQDVVKNNRLKPKYEKIKTLIADAVEQGKKELWLDREGNGKDFTYYELDAIFKKLRKEGYRVNKRYNNHDTENYDGHYISWRHVVPEDEIPKTFFGKVFFRLNSILNHENYN